VALFSVYAQSGAVRALVPDRFSWFAALLPPVYAIVHGLWLALAGYVAAIVILGSLSLWLGDDTVFWLYLLLALLIGFEAPTLRRIKLARRALERLGGGAEVARAVVDDGDGFGHCRFSASPSATSSS
jgi:hypothetical protein